MNAIIVTQARTGSSRLPNKVLKKIKGKTLLEIHINRIKQVHSVDSICVATTENKEDNIIEEISRQLGVNSFRGSENDVLDRYYKAVKKNAPKFIVRLTSDCPLIDPALVDQIIINAQKKKLDYYSNTLIESYPDGQDVEVFSFAALEKAWQNAEISSEREHVTPFIIKNSSFKGGVIFDSDNHLCKINYGNVRITVDHHDDFKVIKSLIDQLGTNATWKEYSDAYIKLSSINKLNSKIQRNMGYLKSLKED